MGKEKAFQNVFGYLLCFVIAKVYFWLQLTSCSGFFLPDLRKVSKLRGGDAGFCDTFSVFRLTALKVVEEQHIALVSKCLWKK